MTAISADTVFIVFLMLCRIGGCLMFMPGFSSPRVPAQIRILIALAVTLALAPVLLPTVSAAAAKAGPAQFLGLILSEVTIGALIGIMGRMFFLALEFMASAVASSIGFTTLPGVPVEHTDPAPALSAFITLTATVLFFVSDLHWEVLRALVASYAAMPVQEAFSPEFGLAQLGDVMADAFRLSLQISSPFIVYAIAINVLFGIANKMTPQIGVYFISLPYVIVGGLLLLYFTIADFMRLFVTGLMNWLTNG